MRFVSKHSPVTVASVKRLAETTTLSVRAIAKQEGLPPSTVQFWIYDHGWNRPAGAAPPPVRVAAGSAARRDRPPSPAQVRRDHLTLVVAMMEEARRQLGALQASSEADAAERERRARTLASLVRTIRQCESLLASAKAAAPASRSTTSEGAPHDHGRSLAELRDEFVRVLARVMAEEQDP